MVEAIGSTVKDLDPIQLDNNDHGKKAYIGCKLQELGTFREFLTPNADLFVFSHADMPVREKLETLLENGSVRESKYPRWVANVVMVKKKNDKWRMCVDFTDLNKACPKDSFLLSHIDQLIDAMAGHELLSFLDAYSGYNQILIEEEGQEKTTFITHQGTYYYRVMPFGLKNAGATYQRCHKFFGILKKENDLQWNSEYVQALKELKVYLSSPPLLSKPEPRQPHLVYIAVSEVAMSAVLVQENKGRLDKWAIELSEDDITYRPRTAIWSQVLADFVADFTAKIMPEVKKDVVHASAKHKTSGSCTPIERPTHQDLGWDSYSKSQHAK
uniref:RNA-directed DNA polymerase homolog n=1 Tax=Nicotiana tabacum TaxID=4097 RepID=A0A1S4C606_TOBAC|nr:PREDICTED: uncharacterized protein LOC107815290 [Nicotiana tabacum]